jgi:hypothetical protein
MAGSYYAYNCWRQHLALMAHGVRAEHICQNPEKYRAFRELIDFTDSYGTRGTELCQKLSHDFYEYLRRAEDYATDEFVANLKRAKASGLKLVPNLDRNQTGGFDLCKRLEDSPEFAAVLATAFGVAPEGDQTPGTDHHQKQKRRVRLEPTAGEGDGSWWLELYQRFFVAFNLASDRGCVCFD